MMSRNKEKELVKVLTKGTKLCSYLAMCLFFFSQGAKGNVSIKLKKLEHIEEKLSYGLNSETSHSNGCNDLALYQKQDETNHTDIADPTVTNACIGLLTLPFTGWKWLAGKATYKPKLYKFSLSIELTHWEKERPFYSLEHDVVQECSKKIEEHVIQNRIPIKYLPYQEGVEHTVEVTYDAKPISSFFSPDELDLVKAGTENTKSAYVFPINNYRGERVYLSFSFKKASSTDDNLQDTKIVNHSMTSSNDAVQLLKSYELGAALVKTGLAMTTPAISTGLVSTALVKSQSILGAQGATSVLAPRTQIDTKPVNNLVGIKDDFGILHNDDYEKFSEEVCSGLGIEHFRSRKVDLTVDGKLSEDINILLLDDHGKMLHKFLEYLLSIEVLGSSETKDLIEFVPLRIEEIAKIHGISIEDVFDFSRNKSFNKLRVNAERISHITEGRLQFKPVDSKWADGMILIWDSKIHNRKINFYMPRFFYLDALTSTSIARTLAGTKNHFASHTPRILNALEGKTILGLISLLDGNLRSQWQKQGELVPEKLETVKKFFPKHAEGCFEQLWDPRSQFFPEGIHYSVHMGRLGRAKENGNLFQDFSETGTTPMQNYDLGYTIKTNISDAIRRILGKQEAFTFIRDGLDLSLIPIEDGEHSLESP